MICHFLKDLTTMGTEGNRKTTEFPTILNEAVS